jgi:hypothetical protein
VTNILGNPNLYGVVMEFAPNDTTDRSQAPFINDVLAAGHSPMLLLPFQTLFPSELPEVALNTLIDFLLQTGARIADPRVVLVLVLARYDQPYLPIQGGSGSIAAALQLAKSRRASIISNATAAEPIYI